MRLLGVLPNKCFLAVSGGADSMAALDFLTRDGKRDVTVMHYNHGTTFGHVAEGFVTAYCADRNIPCIVGHYGADGNELSEADWRKYRYEFFESRFTLPGQVSVELEDQKLITAHNLDDVIETWIFYSLRGVPKRIPYQRGLDIIRPFLPTTKANMERWCSEYDVPYLTDPANASEKHARTIIRHKIMPHALKVNPGLYTTIRKMVESDPSCEKNGDEGIYYGPTLGGR